jgi:hypothetical protein
MKKILLQLIPFLFVFGLTSCTASRLTTPSGYPEVIIGSTDQEIIKSRLINRFSSSGYILSSQTPNSLIFLRQMEPTAEALNEIFLNTSNAQYEIDITFTSFASSTKIYAHAFTTSQGAFGKTDRRDISTGKTGRQLQEILEDIKKSVEIEQRFSSRGKIGIGIKNQVISTVIPQSPADSAGILVGDSILSANGVMLNGDGVHDLDLITGDPNSTVILKIYRDGEEYDIAVVRRKS